MFRMLIQKSSLLYLVAQSVKNPPAMQETWVQSLGWEDPLEKGLATHSSILAWRIRWIEEPDRLQSMGSQRVGHYWTTLIHSLTHSFTLSLYFFILLWSDIYFPVSQFFISGGQSIGTSVLTLLFCYIKQLSLLLCLFLEIISIPKDDKHGKFYMGDSHVISVPVVHIVSIFVYWPGINYLPNYSYKGSW